MDIKLTEKEKKTLIRIDGEFCAADEDSFHEFPELTKEDIHEALKRLAEISLIYYDDDLSAWTITEKGANYITEHHEELKELYDYFYKHI